MPGRSRDVGARSLKKEDKITINDVARLAGVAPGTASRALNSVGYIHEATRDKVMKAAHELNYVPNRAGRTLKTTKTGLVMMAVPDTSNEIYFDMIESFLATIKQNGYSMVLYYTNGQYEEEMHALRMLKESVIDGLYLVNFSYEQNMVEEIGSTPGPVVLCGMCNHLWAKTDDNIFDTISIDVYQGIYDSMKHLVQMGHKKIAYLAGRTGIEVYRQRYEAYRAALTEYGIPYRDDYVFWNDYTELGGYNSGRTLFQMTDRPTAVCASNDLQAIGCWRAIRDLGGKVPEDIAMVGLDNLSVTNILGISSLDMKESFVGEEAAKLLLQRMNQKGSDVVHQHLYFRPELIVRESSLGTVARR